MEIRHNEAAGCLKYNFYYGYNFVNALGKVKCRMGVNTSQKSFFFQEYLSQACNFNLKHKKRSEIYSI